MTLPLLAIAGAATLLALLWLLLRARGRTAYRVRLLAELGFQPVERPDPRLAGALRAMGGRRSGPVLHRRAQEGDLYQVVVRDPGMPRGARAASSVLVVVRDGARLPAFEICSFAVQGGAPGKAMVEAIRQRLGDQHVVRFDDEPGFSRRFTVLSPEADGVPAVRAYLTPAIRQRLLRFDAVLVAADGDALAVQGNPFATARGEGEAAFLRGLVDDATQLAQLLEPQRAAPVATGSA